MYKYDKGKYVKTDDTDQTIGVNNSLVRNANVNSNENSTVSAASLTKSGSSDVFKFNPAMEQRILAAKDRQSMRQQARVRRASGGSERIESQYLKRPDTQETYINRRGKEKKSKLYKHNLNVQERLNPGGVSKSNENQEPTNNDLQKKLGPNTWKPLDKKNLQAVSAGASSFPTKPPTVTPGPSAMNSSVKVNQATSGAPTGTVGFRGQSYPNQAAVDAQIKADNDNEARNLGGSSKDSTADVDAMLKIKQASPSSNPEDVRKIYEITKNNPGESMEDVVAAWKRTREHQ